MPPLRNGALNNQPAYDREPDRDLEVMLGKPKSLLPEESRNARCHE